MKLNKIESIEYRLLLKRYVTFKELLVDYYTPKPKSFDSLYRSGLIYKEIKIMIDNIAEKVARDKLVKDLEFVSKKYIYDDYKRGKINTLYCTEEIAEKLFGVDTDMVRSNVQDL